MEDSQELCLSIGRRHFLVGAAVMIAAKMSGASSLSEVKVFALEAENPAPPDCYHLTLEDANRIAASFEQPDGYLDLATYSTASEDALHALDNLEALFAELGFKQIDSAMAIVLNEWAAYFLTFRRLKCLTADIARELNPTLHGLAFPVLKALDIETAKHLVGYPDGKTCPLALDGLKELTTELAEILASHDHELYLTVPYLNPEAARALACHRGHTLCLTSKSPFPPDTIRAFSSIPMKKLENWGPSPSNNSIWWRLEFKATPEWWG